MTFTASMLGTYSFCPRMFYYRYVLGIEEPPNDLMRRGLLVHAIIAEIAKGNNPDIDSLVQKYNYPYDDNVQAIIKLVNNRVLKEVEFTTVEERFDAKIEGIKFAGVVDAITEDGTMIDWKVVSRIKKARDPLQLAIYAKVFPAKKFEYIQLTEKGIYPVEFHPIDIASGWVRAKTLVNKILRAEYPMNKTRYCPKCFYYPYCKKLNL